MDELLRLEGLEVWAGPQRLLAVDELGLRRGELLVVVGPTGAGKSTLLRALALVEEPRRGRMSWRGRPLSWPVPIEQRRRVAMAFQDPLLFAGSVLHNVCYGLRLRGLSRKAAEARARPLLARFGIEELAGRAVTGLSGGEARRVSLARALVLEPELLLLDEPLAALDEDTRERLGAELLSLVRAPERCTVLVTHDLQDALRWADRIAVVHRGRLVQVAPAEDVFHRPATLEVARLVRTGNLWPVAVVGRQAGLLDLQLGDRRIVGVGDQALGTPLTACLRPEELVLEAPRTDAEGPPGASSARNRIACVVRGLLSEGAVVLVELDCGLPLRARVTRRSAEDMGLAPGVRVDATFKATALHLIPRDAAGAPGDAAPR